MSISKDQWVEKYYYQYWDMLFVYSCNITRDQTVSADVVQEVFISVWNNFDKLVIDNPKAYLLRSVRNNSLRSLQNITYTDIHLEQAYSALTDNDTLTDQEQEIFKQQLVELIYLKAQEILPEKCYQIFLLRFAQRLSYREIAHSLQISEKTVENQIGKAIKSIRTELPYGVDFVIIMTYLLNIS